MNWLSQAVSSGDKHEIDVVVKNAIENKNKDDETGLGQLFGEDPEWMKAIRLLAERSDRIEELLVQQRAFIREEDRPVLGEQALLISETEMLVEMEAKPSVKAEVKTDGDGKERQLVIVIVANRHDQVAKDIAARWTYQGTAILICEDLSISGWRHYLIPIRVQ